MKDRLPEKCNNYEFFETYPAKKKKKWYLILVQHDSYCILARNTCSQISTISITYKYFQSYFFPQIGLQDELQRMREACDNMKQANLRGELDSLKATLAVARPQQQQPSASSSASQQQPQTTIQHPPRPILKRHAQVGEEDLQHHQRFYYHRSKHLGQGYYSLERPLRRPNMYRHYKPHRRLLPQPQTTGTRRGGYSQNAQQDPHQE